MLAQRRYYRPDVGPTYIAIWANYTQPSQHTIEPLVGEQLGGVLLGCV